MTKLEEIKEKILERLERLDFDFKKERNCFVAGYLKALVDIHEINCDEFTELSEDLYEI